MTIKLAFYVNTMNAANNKLQNNVNKCSIMLPFNHNVTILLTQTYLMTNIA